MNPGLSSPILHTPIAGYDARSDLGYGTLKPKFQLPRQLNGMYPYEDPDPYENSENSDEDDDAAIRKKSINYVAVDPFANAAADPFYFAAGNTKLSDCFWRPDFILREIAAFGDSMSPIPQAYKRKGPSMTGYGPAAPYSGGGGTSAKKTGSFQGWASSPPPVDFDIDDEEDELSKEDDTYSLNDLAKKMPVEGCFSF